jgi:hypothetical protein
MFGIEEFTRVYFLNRFIKIHQNIKNLVIILVVETLRILIII